MHRRPSRGHYLEILLFALSAALLYRTPVGVFLFLVPLEIVASRRGLGSLVGAAGLFLAVGLGIQAAPYILSGAVTQPLFLSALEGLIVGLLLLGLIIVNLPLPRRPRSMHLLLAATALAAVVAVPVGLWLAGSSEFQKVMDEVFAGVSATLSDIFSTSDGVAGAFLSSLLEPSRLRALAGAFFLRSLAADYAILLAFSWWAGQAVATRTTALSGAAPKFRFSQFRLESWWLWPLIGAGALILLDLFRGLSFWAYPVWNFGLIVLFLYGLQGLAIVRFLFEKHGLPRFLWLLLLAGFVIISASPGAGLYVLLAIPVFGVSENWIRYRVPRSSAPTEGS